MKIMKKLSILIALALVISIGGVYATWSYAQGTSSGGHQHLSVNLAGYTTTLAKGVIKPVGGAMSLTIDQEDAEHNAMLVLTGNMYFVFKPAAGADDDVLANGIPLQWKVEQSAANNTYLGSESIFVISDDGPFDFAVPPVKLQAADLATYGLDASYEGSFLVTVTPEMVSQYLDIDLQLPTYDDYDDFSDRMASNFTVGVSVVEGPSI